MTTDLVGRVEVPSFTIELFEEQRFFDEEELRHNCSVSISGDSPEQAIAIAETLRELKKEEIARERARFSFGGYVGAQTAYVRVIDSNHSLLYADQEFERREIRA